MTDKPPTIAALFICGGAGERLGGVDKPLVDWRGKPLLTHVLARLGESLSPVVVSANRNEPRYRELLRNAGHTVLDVVTDDPRHQGPLAGVHAGLERFAVAGLSDSDWVFVCPGDTPLLPDRLVARLRAGQRTALDAVIAHDGERRQHLHLLLRVGTRHTLQGFLEGGGYRVYEWLDSLRTAVVTVGTPAEFANFNTPDAFR